jgi:hypothetical protein
MTVSNGQNSAAPIHPIISLPASRPRLIHLPILPPPEPPVTRLGRMPRMTLKIATYNIHKGFSQFNRHMVLHELRDRLHELDADIVFLQEVQGARCK